MIFLLFLFVAFCVCRTRVKFRWGCLHGFLLKGLPEKVLSFFVAQLQFCFFSLKTITWKWVVSNFSVGDVLVWATSFFQDLRWNQWLKWISAQGSNYLSPQKSFKKTTHQAPLVFHWATHEFRGQNVFWKNGWPLKVGRNRIKNQGFWTKKYLVSLATKITYEDRIESIPADGMKHLFLEPSKSLDNMCWKSA